MSEFLFAELAGALERPRIQRRRTAQDNASELVSLLRSRARTAIPPGRLHLCRDPKDDPLIETAIVGGARYLVSRDEDLTRDLDLVDSLLVEYGIEVLTVARFLELLDTQNS